MNRLVRAELLKIRTTRMAWGLLALTLGYTAMQLAVLIAFAGTQGLPPLTDPRTAHLLYALPASSILFVMIMGIVGITGEYRYQTITSAFLATPRRGRVVTAKLVAYALTGLVFGMVATALSMAVATVALTINNVPVSLTEGELPRILGGVVLAYALYALAGVGLGSLLKNQIAAIVTAIGWVLVADTVLNIALPDLGKWLPGGAVNALTRSAGELTGGPRIETLPPWGGALLLLGYGLVFAAIAAMTTTRRDIT